MTREKYEGILNLNLYLEKKKGERENTVKLNIKEINQYHIKLENDKTLLCKFIRGM